MVHFYSTLFIERHIQKPLHFSIFIAGSMYVACRREKLSRHLDTRDDVTCSLLPRMKINFLHFFGIIFIGPVKATVIFL